MSTLKMPHLPSSKKTPPQINDSASVARLNRVLKGSWREAVIFRPVWDRSLLRRCGMNSKRGLITVVGVFLSVSVDPGSSSWMAVLAVTRGSFDHGAAVGER